MASPVQTLHTRCCVVGGGPAGMMLGLLLARAGIQTLVLEKHADFLRDFRGDTVHPSTLGILDELGLKARFDTLPQHREARLEVIFADGIRTLGDFHGIKPFPYIALVPQWDLLNLLADEAGHCADFSLRMQTEAVDLIRDSGTGRVSGVVATTPDGPLHVHADLVVACDGRGSALRKAAGMRPIDLGAPMDVLWFRLPRRNDDPKGTYGIPGRGSILVLINRNDYWQAASVIPKGSASHWTSRPIQDFRHHIARRAAFLADRADAIEAWDDVKLLEVRVDRLPQWHCPGLLLIGDAAHAMSPIGGVGINLAVQDAVAAANILSPVLLQPGLPSQDVLAAVQRRRWLPTRLIQGIQVMLQRRIIAPALSEAPDDRPIDTPAVLKLVERSPFLRSIPARVFGVGFRREHVGPLARKPR